MCEITGISEMTNEDLAEILLANLKFKLVYLYSSQHFLR